LQNKLKNVKMNLIRNAGSILLFALIATAISCQKELHGDGTTTTTTTTNPPVVPPKVCVNCEYLPVCDSSVYIYVDSTSSGVDSNKMWCVY
jgi:hypothetical protein